MDKIDVLGSPPYLIKSNPSALTPVGTALHKTNGFFTAHDPAMNGEETPSLKCARWN